MDEFKKLDMQVPTGGIIRNHRSMFFFFFLGGIVSFIFFLLILSFLFQKNTKPFTPRKFITQPPSQNLPDQSVPLAQPEQ